MRNGFLVVLPGLAAMLTGAAAVQAQPRADYTAHLSMLYSEYQWVLAVRETCNQIQPKQRAELDKSFGVWRDRQQNLTEDLEERLATLVRKASRDQKDYARNYARSQTEVLKQREEGRKQLLALPREDLQRLCAEFPGYLRDARSDISQRLPEDYAAVYGKNLP
jgi:hypothetical protein